MTATRPRRRSAGPALPAVVPIFPLSGVLLLPRGDLPLHVFEPRYRAMTAAALESDRVIAMIQPSSEETDEADPPVYPVGCLGRITAARRTEDGRYYITLTGLCRFRIRDELPPLDGYRRIVPDYDEFAGDLLEDCATVIDRERLLAALKAFVAGSGLTADWSVIDGVRAEPLVNALAMACPFTPGEKQALLEAADLAERSRLLIALLEMGAPPPGMADRSLRH